LAISVTVDFTDPPCRLSEEGETEHVVLGGPPEQLRLTVPVRPPMGATVIV
jgi:hypothetical protein